MRTQVAIIGAGPAGLMLGQLLHNAGIESVIVECRSRDYVESRIRAGVLEPGTVDGLVHAGVGERLKREGMVHEGFVLRFKGVNHRIDLKGLAQRCITVYPQQEVVKDLIAARLAAGAPLHFECEDVRIAGIEEKKARVAWRSAGASHELQCDFIAGCDGFHGICRGAIPAAVLQVHEESYPYAWLGVLARAAPAHDELIYARHDRGFALFSMRSKSLTRLYLQVAPDEDLSAWTDVRIWKELDLRFKGDDGWKPRHGALLDKSITGMRSFMVEPLRHKRLFLAGDAAHIVPPTGAKGMNLAIGDAQILSWSLIKYYREKATWALDVYSGSSLYHSWRAQEFSRFMTKMLHRAPEGSEFENRVQMARLEYVTVSRAAATALAESYAGAPYFSDVRGGNTW